MRIENWCDHEIRFVEINGEWWAILKDICDALNLRTDKIASRLESSMLERIKIVVSNNPLKVNGYEHIPVKNINSSMIGKDIGRHPGENKTRWMLAINEEGIYEALYTSRKLEARKFRRWSLGVMKKLRRNVGLEGYEVMKMTEPDIQEEIYHFLDTLFWDEDKKTLMRSVTIQGGDVDQVPFE